MAHTDTKHRGSPPLVRERHCLTRTIPTVHGITPARAGKTNIVTDCLFSCQDHPRSCGKDRVMKCCDRSILGSPPLVRERPVNGVLVRQVHRITPARAGKTVMDPFICAISLLPVFKIYLISFQSIRTLQLLRNLGGC